MRFSHTHALLSTVLAPVIISAMPAPQAADTYAVCSADGKSYTIGSAPPVACQAGYVCTPAAIAKKWAVPCEMGNADPSGTVTADPKITTTLAPAKAARKVKDGKRLVIYRSVWDDVMKEPTAAELKGVTQFIFAFVDMTSMNSFPYSRHQTTQESHPNILFTAAFGGWGLDQDFRPKTMTEAARTAFAEEMAALVDSMGFDGVDLDWEYPGGNGAFYKTSRPDDPDEGRRFALFIEKLREKLGEEKTITIAVPAKPEDVAKAYDNITVPYMDAYIDSWNVMSYDFVNRRDSLAGHHAGKTVMNNALALWQGLGLDPIKINLGVPYYAKYYKVVGDCEEDNPLGCKLAVMETASGDDAGAEFSGSLRLDETLNAPESSSAQLSWNNLMANPAKILSDAEAGASYWYDASTKYFWSFLTPRDVTAACKYYKPSVGGMMAWALHQDGAGAPLQIALAECYGAAA